MDNRFKIYDVLVEIQDLLYSANADGTTATDKERLIEDAIAKVDEAMTLL